MKFKNKASKKIISIALAAFMSSSLMIASISYAFDDTNSTDIEETINSENINENEGLNNDSINQNVNANVKNESETDINSYNNSYKSKLNSDENTNYIKKNSQSEVKNNTNKEIESNSDNISDSDTKNEVSSRDEDRNEDQKKINIKDSFSFRKNTDNFKKYDENEYKKKQDLNKYKENDYSQEKENSVSQEKKESIDNIKKDSNKLILSDKFKGVIEEKPQKTNSNKDEKFTGFVKEDKKWYFYKDNELKKGWVHYGGNTYYILNTYTLPQNMWRVIKGKKYYFNKDGIMLRNQKAKIEGQIYQFDSNGHLVDNDDSIKLNEVTSEQKKLYELGKKTLENSKGNLRNGIYKEKGKLYRYIDGKKKRGWYKEDGKTYYFLNTLNRAQGMWRVIKGKKYYFGSDGAMYNNTIKYIDGKTYKFNKDGSIDSNVKTSFTNKDVYLKTSPKGENNGKKIPKGWGIEILESKNGYSKVSNADGSAIGWIPDSVYLSSSEKKINDVIKVAKSKLGTAYVWGGTGPNNFDCSGLMMYSFKHGANIKLPRVSKDQARTGRYVSRSNLRKGDLVFWGNPIHHVALYIGDGRYLHAPEPGTVVRINKLGYYTTARRIIE